MCLNAVDSYFGQQIATADAFINGAFKNQGNSLLAKELQGILFGALGGAAGLVTGGPLSVVLTLAGLGNPAEWSVYIPYLLENAAATTITGAVYGGFAGVFAAAAWLVLLNANSQSVVINAVNAAYGQMEQQGEQACQSQVGGN